MLHMPSMPPSWQWLAALTVAGKQRAEMWTFLSLTLTASPTREFSVKSYRFSMTVVSPILSDRHMFYFIVFIYNNDKNINLCSKGFLTDDLVSHEDNGEQKKYMGVCRLPGPGRRHRRLDVIVVPYEEFACSLMYFTGSAHFNRSMRALAKTKNMSLSEHSLNKDVVRQGSLKTHGGNPLPTATEKDVFRLLGIPYRPPQERDW